LPAAAAAVAAGAADGETAMKAAAAIILALIFGTAAMTSGIAAPAAPQEVTVPETARTFETAETAVTALIDAVRADNPKSVQNVLGRGSEKLVTSGDRYSDAAERRRFLAAYDESHKLVVADHSQTVLEVGKDDWPFPIPLVQTDGRWHFDAEVGAQELVDRRIGRNEIAAIRTSLAYVDAQKAFFALNAHYAERLISAPGKHDGLYWPAAEGEPESPLAPLIAQAQEEGYPGRRFKGKPVPYHGYFFRVLTGQGDSAAEGAVNYLSGGRMNKGFALIAWPASFGASGIMTFVVNQDGIVFQKDLGPDTGVAAAAIKLFDPDLSWARVNVVN
jgi:Protein of unknown function (DUF2950)